MSNSQLDALIVNQPAEVEAEILRINYQASTTALQVALLIPLFASLLGLLNSFRMVKLPDPEPSSTAEMVLGG